MNRPSGSGSVKSSVRFKGPCTLSDYATVTVTLTGGAFEDQRCRPSRYGDRSVIARCEWTLIHEFMVMLQNGSGTNKERQVERHNTFR